MAKANLSDEDRKNLSTMMGCCIIFTIGVPLVALIVAMSWRLFKWIAM